MSSSKTSNSRLFLALAAVTMVAAAFAVVLMRYHIESNGGGALLYARTRHLFDPHNTQLGMSYVRQELEADKLNSVVLDVSHVCSAHITEEPCLELTGAVWAITGTNKGGLLLFEQSPGTSVAARSALTNLAGSEYTKAQELYVLGLVRSSQRIVAALPDTTVPVALLKAHLALDGIADGGVAMAQAEVNKALVLNPTSREALVLALAVSRRTANKDGQQKIEARLQTIERQR